MQEKGPDSADLTVDTLDIPDPPKEERVEETELVDSRVNISNDEIPPPIDFTIIQINI